MRFGYMLVLALVSAPAAAECVLNKLAELPATMNGSRPEISAKINGRDARFLIDSGAFYSLISPGVAAENKLWLEAAPGGFYISGVGGTAAASVARVKVLSLAGLELPGLQFLVGGSEVGASGVLGQNLLHLADVEYNLAHGMVVLLRPKSCAGSNLAYWAGAGPVSFLPLEANQSKVSQTMATVLINGQKVHAMFDTGAITSVLSLAAAARAGIKPDSPGVVANGFSRGVGRRMVQTWVAPVANVTIGDEELHNTRLHIADLGPGVEMLLGADFFLAHRVLVANSQNRIYFSYNGGPVFAAAGTGLRAVDGQGQAFAAPQSTAEAATPEALSRRGMALAARGDLPGALADLDRAVKDAPAEPRYLLQRAGLQRQLEHPDLAEADVNKALALKPDDPEALIERALFRARSGRSDAAVADLDQAARVADRASDLHFTLGEVYAGLKHFDQVVSETDLWVARHPADSRRPIALNNACWARALLGRELAKALDDCTTAIRTMPHKELALDSRGLVNLRLGNPAAAIKDYDAALAIRPKIAWSLYGRGLAKLKLGQKEAGDKDIAAAEAIDPKLRDEARGYGIAP